MEKAGEDEEAWGDKRKERAKQKVIIIYSSPLDLALFVFSLLLTILSLPQLFTAAREGRVHDVVQLLSGVGVNEIDKVSVCVYMCVYNHYVEFCHVLQDGNIPLHVACSRGHSDVVQTLLKSGADLKLQNEVCESCNDALTVWSYPSIMIFCCIVKK